jgi:hypothetical protein
MEGNRKGETFFGNGPGGMRQVGGPTEKETDLRSGWKRPLGLILEDAGTDNISIYSHFLDNKKLEARVVNIL